jgi:iron complex outermembrane recepter protein
MNAFCVWAGLCVVVAVAAHAQSSGSKPDTTIKSKQLPDVVVTATRAPKNLLDVPLAISVVPTEVLQTQRGFGLDGVLTLTPGVLAQSRTGGVDTRVQIRGFGARGAGERSNAGTTRGVRFYQDGIPETEPDGRTAFELMNLVHASRVEVVRTNASALYGNAAGGVVSLSSIPTTSSSFVDAGATIGSFGLTRQQILANAQVGDGQVYLSLMNTGFDGWRDNSDGGILQGTLGIITKPSAVTQLNVFLTGAHNTFNIPGPLTLSQFEADASQAQGDTSVFRPTYVQRQERRNNNVGRIGATLTHQITENQTIQSMAFLQSKYLQRSERNTFRDFHRYHTGGNTIYSFRADIAPEVRSTFLAGGDIQYQDGAILFYNLSSDAQRGTTLTQNKREGALTAGAFAQSEIHYSHLQATIGLRYDAVTYFFQDFISPKLDDDKMFTRVTPKIGLSWNAQEWGTFYGNIGGGLEVPAGNETDPPRVQGLDTISGLNPLLNAITSTTFEIGWKGATPKVVSNMEFQYDLAAFYIDVENDLIPYRDGIFYLSAGRTRRIGIETGLQALHHSGLQAIFTANVMSATYVDFKLDSSFINSSFTGIRSFDNNKQSGIPSVSGALRLRYSPQWLFGTYIEAEARHVGSYFADDANTIEVMGFTTVALAAGASVDITRGISANVMVRVDNATDAQYMASAYINPSVARVASAGFPYIEPGLPLNYTATVGFRYSP